MTRGFSPTHTNKTKPNNLRIVSEKLYYPCIFCERVFYTFDRRNSIFYYAYIGYEEIGRKEEKGALTRRSKWRMNTNRTKPNNLRVVSEKFYILHISIVNRYFIHLTDIIVSIHIQSYTLTKQNQTTYGSCQKNVTICASLVNIYFII